MNHALSMEDFSKLHAHLVVPLIVGDIMAGTETLDDESRYTLHDALSEIDPDSALLAIALSAQHIASAFMGVIPVSLAVKFEAEKSLQEYGPEWLSNYYGGPVDEHALFDMLQTLPEDLEAMADLLDALRASLTGNATAHDLCEILSIQARAHMEIADFILGELDREISMGADTASDDSAAEQTAAPLTTAQGNIAQGNVIPFPASRVRH